MRVITFSIFFPAYHPRKNENTDFVFKIWKGIMSIGMEVPTVFIENYIAQLKCDMPSFYNTEPKYHTIRAGNRWKVGDKFSPRVWSGKPYASKQIEFAPPIEIKKILDFKFIPKPWIDESSIEISGRKIESPEFNLLAMNDGLSTYDLLYWFGEGMEMSTKRKPFEGKIICWNQNIEY